METTFSVRFEVVIVGTTLCTLCLCRFFRVLNSDQFVQSFVAPTTCSLATCSYYLYGVPVWTFPGGVECTCLDVSMRGGVYLFGRGKPYGITQACGNVRRKEAPDGTLRGWERGKLAA